MVQSATLAASEHCMMGAPETQRGWDYKPRHEENASQFFPQRVCAALHQAPQLTRCSLDVLFLMFFARVGTREQLLAAEELQRRGWAYHRKYQTWFQRVGEATSRTDKAESGTYLIFDNERWCQLEKPDFTFYYEFLVE